MYLSVAVTTAKLRPNIKHKSIFTYYLVIDVKQDLESVRD
jgi:hypothetical protein